jgi:hypothetical protein
MAARISGDAVADLSWYTNVSWHTYLRKQCKHRGVADTHRGVAGKGHEQRRTVDKRA